MQSPSPVLQMKSSAVYDSWLEQLSLNGNIIMDDRCQSASLVHRLGRLRAKEYSTGASLMGNN